MGTETQAGTLDTDAMWNVVERYLHALERSDFDAAGECFTEDARYSHPPYDGGTDRGEVVGRDAIVAMSKNSRSDRSWFHVIESFSGAGDRCYMEVTCRDGKDGPVLMTGIGCGVFDTDSGLLKQWVGYQSIPPVWATLAT